MGATYQMKSIAITLCLLAWPVHAGASFWDRKSLCAYIYQKQVEGLSVEQLKALARANSIPERVIRWAEKNC